MDIKPFDQLGDIMGDLVGYTVISQFESMRAYADDSRDVAFDYLAELKNATYGVPQITIGALPEIPEPGPGTGLGADVEDALWNRQEERDLLDLQEAKDRVTAEWAARGFGLPDGVLTMLLMDLETKHSDARLTASREIAVKQAELALNNAHFAIESKIKEAEIWANVAIKQADINLNAFTGTMSAQMEIAKAMAQIASQLAASAMSAVNINAGMSETDHRQKTQSTQNSVSESYQRQESAHIQSSVSQQTSNSTETRTEYIYQYGSGSK